MVANKRRSAWKGSADTRLVDKSAELGGLMSYGRVNLAEVRKIWPER